MPDRFVFVAGRPAPQGSKSYKGHRNGKPVLVESSKAVKPWRELVACAARQRGGILSPAPIHAQLAFVLPRPVQTAKRQPTPPAVKRPDLDKLTRAVFDALTGVWIADDSHVVSVLATKRIAEVDETPGVAITLTKEDQK